MATFENWALQVCQDQPDDEPSKYAAASIDFENNNMQYFNAQGSVGTEQVRCMLRNHVRSLQHEVSSRSSVWP